MIGVEKMESLQVQLPDDLQEAIKAMIGDALSEAIKDVQTKNSFPPYLNKGEANTYCGVSRGIFNSWIKKYDIPTIQIDIPKDNKRLADIFDMLIHNCYEIEDIQLGINNIMNAANQMPQYQDE